MFSTNDIFCKHCVNPQGLGIINPNTQKEMKFFMGNNGIVCELCQEIISTNNLPSREQFNEELTTFLNANHRILFAYSGGLDSTVVLAKLNDECQRRGIDLRLFTVNTEVKGRVAMQNVDAVLRHLGLNAQHFYIDISQQIQHSPKIMELTGKPMTTVDVYRYCLTQGILPCGKTCNIMIDQAYDQAMATLNFQVLVTGGDTPKKNSLGVYSLFWKKPSGITIVRGGYGLALTKELNAKFISEHGIPWIHPQCGGYDTDCLVPGVFFSDRLNGQPEQEAKMTVTQFPIILDYLAERVRFGVINRDQGLQLLTRVDIASSESHRELMDILNRINP